MRARRRNRRAASLPFDKFPYLRNLKLSLSRTSYVSIIPHNERPVSSSSVYIYALARDLLLRRLSIFYSSRAEIARSIRPRRLYTLSEIFVRRSCCSLFRSAARFLFAPRCYTVQCIVFSYLLFFFLFLSRRSLFPPVSSSLFCPLICFLSVERARDSISPRERRAERESEVFLVGIISLF